MGKRIYNWVLNHDNSLIFILLYVGLAIYLSIAFGLFWLLVVVIIHLLLELIRQFHFRQRLSTTIIYSFWELKLDFFLILFAFALEVYMGVVLGVLGLGATARVAMQMGSRFAAWENTLKGILLSVDDLALILRGWFSKKNKVVNDNLEDTGEPELLNNSVVKLEMGRGDYFSLIFGGLVCFSIAVAPYFTEYDYYEILILFKDVFHP